MKLSFLRKEKVKILFFYTLLTIILTWPVFGHLFSSVPSFGSDTMQVIGVAGNQANLLRDEGIIRGTLDLGKRAELNMLTVYAYFQLIFGRILGFNLLFYLSFILSGFGCYLLTDYFIGNKKAAFLAGLIYAFAPFHVHNALGTNVGTMHQEWLPFFALYLFKFFEKFEFKKFLGLAIFLFLIGLTEHQLLAFTLLFILFFVFYKLLTKPRTFLDKRLWAYFVVSAAIFSVVFFFIFRNLFAIATSSKNFLDAGMGSAVRYSNDSLSIFVTPNFHSFWPKAFGKLREQFRRKSSSTFSVYAGYTVLLLSLLGIVFWKYMKKRGQAVKGIFFWLAVALGFYILSLGPYLHYKGVLDPPVRMPYYLVYQYLPFYKNIRTVGRLFIFSMLAFSLLAAWGMNFLQIYSQKISSKFPPTLKLWRTGKIQNSKFTEAKDGIIATKKEKKLISSVKKNILYFILALIIIVEYLAIPLKTNSLLHSSFYEKLGQDKENYSVLEVPGSTSYDFASRDLVWGSIHRKQTINGYDFARVIKENYKFQRGTPIIRTVLYDLPGGDKGNDRDIMKNSYYNISSEILNYYNIRYIILDKKGLKGNPAKGDVNQFYPAKAYVTNVIKCADEYEDDYLFACKIDVNDKPQHMFLAMDYSNSHWVKKGDAKNGLQRWAENGAGVKLVNMTGAIQKSKLNFNLKIAKPLRLKVFLNSKEIYNKYITAVGQKQAITAELPAINPGENDIVFGVYAADNSEIYSDKKSDTAIIYGVEVD